MPYRKTDQPTMASSALSAAQLFWTSVLTDHRGFLTQIFRINRPRDIAINHILLMQVLQVVIACSNN